MLCASCTARYAVVQIWHNGTCDCDSDAILRPLERSELELPEDSADRAPIVDIVTLAQLHCQGRDIVRRTVTRNDRVWYGGIPHARAATTVLAEGGPWAGVTLDRDANPVDRADGYAVALRPTVLRSAHRAPYVGVFRNEVTDELDIDEVIIVDTLREAQAVSVFVGAKGGAYSFSDGLGYWTPTAA